MDKKQRMINQTYALAGLFQAVHLVEQLAKSGQTNEDSFKVCINSLFETNPEDFNAVYGGDFKNLRLGMQEVRFLTDGKTRTGSSPDVLRYALSILHLETKLRKNQKMLKQISTGLDHAHRQSEHFHRTHENVMANLSGIYQETLSTFKFRVHVTGNAQHLKNNYTAHKIRALLLCGIRSAILWRQMGGRRWQLIFNRRKLNRYANRSLSKM